jgi:soluble lytic murein transglycosylase-like protein
MTGGRFRALARFAPAVAVALFAGAACAQEEVHIDGSVVIYDGARQRMSPGAHPTARILNPKPYPSASEGHGGKVTGTTAPAPPPEVATAIHDSAQRHNVDEGLVQAVAWQESRYKTGAVSAKGARGAMQLMPDTARSLGVDSSDTAGNIEGGVVYLSKMMNRYGGDTEKAQAAYNAGPGAVDRYGGVPPYRETQGYVHSVMGKLTRKDSTGVTVVEDTGPLKTRMGAE